MSIPSRSSPLVRAVLVGLAGGLFTGAGVLGWWAFQSTEVDCTQLTPQECLFHKEAAEHLGRLQALSAIALALLGAATLFALRAMRRRDDP